MCEDKNTVLNTEVYGGLSPNLRGPQVYSMKPLPTILNVTQRET